MLSCFNENTGGQFIKHIHRVVCPQKSIPLNCGTRLAILDFVAGSSATAASVVVISNETLQEQIIILDKFEGFLVIRKDQQLPLLDCTLLHLEVQYESLLQDQ
jgi:hypothetical protein